MAFSSGTRIAYDELISWVAAAACMVLSFVYFDELKLGIRIAFGLPSPSTSAPMVAAATKGNSATPAKSDRTHVEIKAGSNGHFFTPVDVNGRTIDVMVDTGASLVALTYEDAERVGIFVGDADFTHTVSTANGSARIALVQLDDVQIGDIRVQNVEAAVSERGRLKTTLLGMSFLGRLQRAEMRQGVLILED